MKPPFIIRVLAFVPLTAMLWIALLGFAFMVPFIVLFGKWEFKGKSL